jgi:hypothetical protein
MSTGLARLRRAPQGEELVFFERLFRFPSLTLRSAAQQRVSKGEARNMSGLHAS